MIILWIIIAIVIFSLVILIHEFGHFYAARKFGVKVLEFGLGIPPKAKTLFIDKMWTKYTLNWLPLWWFVRLNWEDKKELDKNDKTKFYNKSYLQKSVILLAWVFMNFLLASIIFSVLFFIWIKPIWINSIIPSDLKSKIIPTYQVAIEDWILIKNNWLILNPIKDSIAQKWWISSWDILLEVNDTVFNSTKKLINIFKENKSQEIKLKIKSKNNEIKIINIKLDKEGKVGMYIWENIELNKDFEYKYGLFQSIKYWFYETYVQSVLTLKWLWSLVQKIFNPKDKEERQQAVKQISWPIWIVDFMSNNIWAWIIFLTIITAIISINLWIFNLLPIPALDWGRFFLLTINTIIKKIFKGKIDTNNFENLLHIIFFIILIVLSLLIWYNDVDKIINR